MSPKKKTAKKKTARKRTTTKKAAKKAAVVPVEALPPTKFTKPPKNLKPLAPAPPATRTAEVKGRVNIMAAREKFAELNFDPLELSIRVALGMELQEDHPFLAMLYSFFMGYIRKAEKDGNETVEIPVDEINALEEQAKKLLSDSWTPHNIRSQHIQELMSYAYPKLKAVEHSGQVNHDIRVTVLTAHEVTIFEEKFNDEF